MNRRMSGDCCGREDEGGAITLPGTYDHDTPWKFYNHLIGQIPEDVLVTDCCVGPGWTYVEAECGMGLSYTLKGGGAASYGGRLDGLPLKSVAELSKSWNWLEACLGVAALNAWYTNEDAVRTLGGALADVSATQLGQNPFRTLRENYRGKQVTVIGHFPDLDSVAEIAELTILERNCTQSNDTPDPACEYLLPKQDFVFMTGVTLINKTAPRLLDLAQNATVVMVGPSVPASEFLFSWGINVLAGRIVVDPEKAKVCVKQAAKFGDALQAFSIERLKGNI
ncbi:MAG: DUF364 domain-containing protein [Coriobacteriales bacterium]|nr:DUF364 domain-containing protein [Coriobacteriales bacterium]